MPYSYRGTVEVMPREDFLAKKAELERVRAERRDHKPKALASANKEAVRRRPPLRRADLVATRIAIPLDTGHTG